MSYTMEDFTRDYFMEHFPRLTLEEQCEALERLPSARRREVLQSLPPEERRVVLQSLPPEERMAGLSAKQIREYLDRMTAGRPAETRKPRRKK